MLNKTAKYALYYREQGFSVIPVHPQKNKGPYLKEWKQYQHNLPEKKDIKKWWTDWPDAAIAIVTGKISNTIVLDVNNNSESKSFLKNKKLPITTSVKIGDQGVHYYYKYPENINKVFSLEGNKILPGIKLKADENYVYAPPSISENGIKYKFHEAMNNKYLKLSDAPEWLLQIIREQNMQNSQLLHNSTKTITKNNQNQKSTQKQHINNKNTENDKLNISKTTADADKIILQKNNINNESLSEKENTDINKTESNDNNKTSDTAKEKTTIDKTNVDKSNNDLQYNNKQDKNTALSEPDNNKHNKKTASDNSNTNKQNENKSKENTKKENLDKQNTESHSSNTNKNNKEKTDNTYSHKKHVLSRKNPLNKKHLIGLNGSLSTKIDSDQISAEIKQDKNKSSSQNNPVSLKSTSQNKKPEQYHNKTLTNNNTALKTEQTEERIISQKNNVIRFNQQNQENIKHKSAQEVESYPDYQPEETPEKSKDEKDKFYPAQIAQEVLKQEKAQDNHWAYILETDQYYYYNRGYWQPQHKRYLFKAIRKVLRKYNREWDKTNYKEEVVNLLEEDFLLEPENKERFIKNNHHHTDLINADLINVKNGMLDWKNDELKSHDPEYNSQIQLPVKYEPDANYTLWEKTLKEWVPDKDSRNFLQEYAGYCLLPDTSLQKALILYGKGNNGKSTFLTTLSHLFGEKNLNRTEASEFKDDFQYKKIRNKLINISSKTQPQELNENITIKNIISGEKFQVEIDSDIENYTYNPITKLIFSLNELPELKAKSDSWAELFNIIVFPNQFNEDKSKFDPYLKNKLIKELPGILNWALAGLKRIRQQGYFTSSRAVKENELKYRLQNNENDLTLLLKEIKNDRQQFREDLLKEIKNMICDE